MLIEETSARILRESPGVPANLWSDALLAPAREFLQRPSKHFRARLTRHAFAVVTDSPCPERLPYIAELIHAGSLVIDDIEDAAELRRGAPALHHLTGIPRAINIGNWMYFWALDNIDRLDVAPKLYPRISRAVTRAILQCHEGQALDLGVRVFDLSRDQLQTVVSTAANHKTGALTELAATLGALVGGGTSDEVAAIATFGRNLGSALQMFDDASSVANLARAGKGLEDLRGGRLTWPWVWLSTTASTEVFARAQHLAATKGNDDLHELAEILSGPAESIGLPQARAHLDHALAELAAALGHPSRVAVFADELARLKEAYV